ncbi:MAG: PspC domain-containing protein [Thermoflexibacter sp.]|jgi:phage shock protein C|nr:PspC domain-containing protein [Thermoflexibacter sp.]
MNLVKSDRNKMLTGVCGGLGEHLGIDPAIIRIGFVACTVLGIGFPVIAYLVLAFVMKRETYY